jgi:hypothetical protein
MGAEWVDGDAYTMSWVKRPTIYTYSMHTKLQKQE